MAVLSFSELETSLLNILTPQPAYTPLVVDYFKNLYYTGCRPTELYNITRWNFIGADTYTLQPSKNNNIRIIAGSMLTATLKDCINLPAPRPYAYKYWKQLYFFEKWYQYQPCHVGGKSIDLYLFRHHFVKKLALDGMSVPAITAYMGWINPAMADNYINSVIETP